MCVYFFPFPFTIIIAAIIIIIIIGLILWAQRMLNLPDNGAFRQGHNGALSRRVSLSLSFLLSVILSFCIYCINGRCLLSVIFPGGGFFFSTSAPALKSKNE